MTCQTSFSLCPECEKRLADFMAHASKFYALHSAPIAKRAPEFTFVRWTEVFWSRVDRRGPDECWPWLNGKTSGGTGNVGVPIAFRDRLGAPKNGCMLAHRVAFALTHGPIPRGASICHRCSGQRDCCNPAHLYLGNHNENANDEAVKFRLRSVGGSP